MRLSIRLVNENELYSASMAITRNNQYLIVTPDAADDEGSYGDNTVYYVELAGNEPANWQIRPLVVTFNAGYRVS